MSTLRYSERIGAPFRRTKKLHLKTYGLRFPEYGIVASLAATLYALKEVFGGPFRYFTSITGTVFLNYLPPFLAIMALALFYAKVTKEACISRVMLSASAIILLFFSYSLICSVPFLQSLFGFYIWLPFITGLLVGFRWVEKTAVKWALIVWAISVVGVIVNSLVSFPWEGSSYEVFGVAREMSRKWEYMGYSRIAGFGRSSFATADLILALACVVLTAKRIPILARWGCYLFSCYPMFLTTNKTSLVLWAVIPLFVCGYHACRVFFPPRLLSPYRWAAACIFLMLAMVIGLPLWGEMPGLLDSTASYSIFSLKSLAVRVEYAWPMSFALLSHGGNFLLGRGVGGIGAPQEFGEPSLYMFGDNLFVYVFVSTGLVGSVALFAGLVANLKTSYIADHQVFETVFVLLIYVLGIAITANTIEGPVQALILAMIVARSSRVRMKVALPSLRNQVQSRGHFVRTQILAR